MATTYDRIRALMEEVRRNEKAGEKARDYYDLSDFLAKKKIKEFVIDSEDGRFMSAAALSE